MLRKIKRLLSVDGILLSEACANLDVRLVTAVHDLALSMLFPTYGSHLRNNHELWGYIQITAAAHNRFLELNGENFGDHEKSQYRKKLALLVASGHDDALPFYAQDSYSLKKFHEIGLLEDESEQKKLEELAGSYVCYLEWVYDKCKLDDAVLDNLLTPN